MYQVCPKSNAQISRIFLVNIQHNLIVISIFLKPETAISNRKSDDANFSRSSVFPPYWFEFPSHLFPARSLKFLSSPASFTLSFESSFSLKLNNSFGRPPYRFPNKIVGTIFVRSSFPIPSSSVIPPRSSTHPHSSPLPFNFSTYLTSNYSSSPLPRILVQSKLD